MGDEVDRSDETAWGSEPVATGGGFFVLASEGADLGEIHVPGVDTHVVGDQPNSNNKHSHIIRRLSTNVN